MKIIATIILVLLPFPLYAEQVIHVSPVGSDSSSDPTDVATPAASIEAAYDYVVDHYAGTTVDEDITVLVEPGEYNAQPGFTWDFLGNLTDKPSHEMPDYQSGITITIIGKDISEEVSDGIVIAGNKAYVPSIGSGQFSVSETESAIVKPVFDGSGLHTLELDNGYQRYSGFIRFRDIPEGVQVVIKNIHIKNYKQGILIDNAGKPWSNPRGSAHVEDVVFRMIGQKYTTVTCRKNLSGECVDITQTYAAHALGITRSNGNDVINNAFIMVENDESNRGKIHAIYLAYDSDRNNISGNTFASVSGDPVRIRDGSDETTVIGNTFFRSGIHGLNSNGGYQGAAISDYGDESCGTVIHSNSVGSSHRCGEIDRACPGSGIDEGTALRDCSDGSCEVQQCIYDTHGIPETCPTQAEISNFIANTNFISDPECD